MSHATLLASRRSGPAAALHAMVAPHAAIGSSRSCHPARVSAGIGNPNCPFKRAFGAI